jgi:predicted metal-dependent phosphoesterase TrpH
MSDQMRLDLHVHSRHSPDSPLTLEAILDRLGVAGVQGFALTDHNTIDGHGRLADLQRENPRWLLIPGVEVSTEDGHLLVYGVRERPPSGQPLENTLDWVRSHDGVSVLAHPFRWAHGVGRRLAESAAADGIETMNGHNGEVANAQAELIAAHRGLAATGGSDAHDLKGIGRTFTSVPERVESVDDLIPLLRAHRVSAGGHSLPTGARLGVSMRSAMLRALRGFRPI